MKHPFKVRFLRPINLSEWSGSKKQRVKKKLDAKGVYFLYEGKRPSSFSPTSSNIVYVGRAWGETIFSRCQKHYWTIVKQKHANGTPRTRPGKKFKKYRKTIKHDPSRLWVVGGLVDPNEPWAVTCMEVFYMCAYEAKHGELPKANTARHVKVTE